MKYTFFFFLLLFSFNSFTQNAKLYGAIKNENDAPLQGVILQAVNHENISTVSDEYGEFTLTIPAKEEVLLKASFIGFKPMLYKVFLNANESQRLNIRMTVSDLELEGIEIESEIEREKASVYKIKSEKLKQLPAVSGGVEALIKTLPGVRSNNELSSRYSVRGGSYDENVVYINNFEITRPQLIRAGQQEGLSVINSQLADDIYFSAGGFESQFGDKLSSVLSIQYNEPNKFSGTSYLGFMGAGVAVKDRSKNDKFYYSASGRFKSNKYLLNSLEEEGEYNPVSYDGQTLIGTHLSTSSKLEFLGYANKTKYDFIPSLKNASFGTYENVLTFQANIDGEENDSYETLFAGLNYENQIQDNIKINFRLGLQNNDEKESIDFLSNYFLGEQNIQTGEVDTLAQGNQIDFVNNTLKSNRIFLNHTGVYNSNNEKHFMAWGAGVNHYNFDDELNENDKLTIIDELDNSIETIYDKKINNSKDLSNSIIDGFIQDTYIPTNLDELTITGGTRFSYSTFTKDFLVSPRIQASYRPNASQSVLRFATGLYQQHPLYREFRNINGDFNSELEAQKSIHGIVGIDYKFSSKQDLPFKLTAEAYYKNYWDVVPYEYDVIRIRYLGENNATAYVAGIDARLYGEFVKNAPSWISISVLKTEEDVEGQGKVRRPTDQRLNMSVFWQDYFSTNENFKVNMVGEFGGRLPVGQADGDRLNDNFDLPSYKRLDVGFSANLKGIRAARLPNSPFENVQSVWLSAELFNLFNIQNTSSYQWVTTPQNAVYAIPNRLTSRRLNAKLTVEF